MSERKWTPGPWEVTFFDGNQTISVTARGGCVAYAVHAPDHKWNEDCRIVRAKAECNARLIAATPELFDALDRLLIEIGEGSSRGRALDLIPSKTVAQARAALAKAVSP